MPGSFDQHFERGEQALSHDQYVEALASFEAALTAAHVPHQKASALDGMAVANFHLKEDQRAFEQLDQAIALCLPLADTDEPAALALARIWYDKAGMFAGLGRIEDALAALEPLVGRFVDQASASGVRDEENPLLRLRIVRSMGMKATALRKLDRKREAIACYDDMIRRFQSVDDVAVEEVLSRAMLNRAWLLGDLGRWEEEIAAYDALVARYGENHLLSVSHTIIDALTGKLQCYRDQEEFEKALEPCDDIIRRYEFDSGEGIADRVARTMIRRADLLNKLDRMEEELAAYDKVVLYYGELEEPDLRKHAAKALMFKAVTLNDADQSAAEIECYEEVIGRYAEDADEEVRVVAADALIHKGLSLGAIAEDAAEDTGEREVEAEIACYDAVVAQYGDAEFIGLKRAVAEAMLHKSETLLEVGRVGEASQCLDRVIAGYASIEDEDLAEIVKDARALKAQI
jgi:tetratricopeptide (TPR) repeat protein